MELSTLRIEDFRNLGALTFSPGPRFNIFYGANGQGKTNLLEAVYLLSAVKSFRPQRNSELIRWGSKLAVVEGCIERAGVERTARIDISPQGKKVQLNGTAVKNLSTFFGSLNAIVFSPDDLNILKGGPDERRRFVDRAIFNVSASYLSDVMAYQSVLKRRNALLRDERNPAMLLDVYDEQLANLGAAIALRRLRYLQAFAPLFRETFNAIFAGADPATPVDAPVDAPKVVISYRAGWLGGLARPGTLDEDEPALAERLQKTLASGRREDLRRGFTTRGPHRDDLHLSLEGHALRAFASQGQQRAVVLAMKIAEVRLFQQHRGFRPILLLDDVSSELDRVRNRYLFDFLQNNPGQVFITTTHRDHILLDDQLAAFSVAHGSLERTE